MASVRKEDSLVLVYKENAAAQDAVKSLGNLTKGPVANEKAVAAIGALHILAQLPRRAALFASSPYRSNVRARSIMPAGPAFRLAA